MCNGHFLLNVHWDDSGVKLADWKWTAIGVGSASVHLSEGEGPFHIHTDFVGLRATIDGKANLPRRFVEGKGKAVNIIWQGKRLRQIGVEFSLSPQHQELKAVVTDAQFHPPAEKRVGVRGARLT